MSNFDVNTTSVVPNFPYTGTWYNLMDNSSFEVINTTAPITIEAGGFRIYGNKPSSNLGTDKFKENTEIYLYPNPTSNYFNISTTSLKVQIFTLTGQMVKSFNMIQSKEQQFSVSDLNSGIYFVKVDDGENVYSQKLIRN